ncbi:hypothetical protein SLS62_003497 [Diatrype stigma]|uniref:Uncharacterized protein n=1 Tax=Diatrype stigma TaxID=117547 RepID=A0AAN9UWE8_9PEZI
MAHPRRSTLSATPAPCSDSQDYIERITSVIHACAHHKSVAFQKGSKLTNCIPVLEDAPGEYKHETLDALDSVSVR